MPLVETQYQAYDGQTDFSGGMNAFAEKPAQNQYRHGRNLEIRGGPARTRRGVARAFPANAGGMLVGFYFNQENARYRDADHAGFWFENDENAPFEFGRSVQGGNVSAWCVVKAQEWEQERILAIFDDVPMLVNEDRVTAIACIDEIDATEQNLSLVQAGQQVFMFRGENHRPLVYSFDENGFQPVAAPGIADEGGAGTEDDLYWDAAPNARGAVYYLGRLWAWINDDEIAASDILAFNNWDLFQNRFAIQYGDGQRINAIIPFTKDILFVGKSGSMHALTGANSANLSSLARRTVDAVHGLVGKNAWCVVGEDLWFMSWDGIYSINRNQYDELQAAPVSISAPISNLIARINWPYAGRIAMTLADNYIMVAVPLNGSTKNNGVLVFDRLLNVWVGYWDGPTCNPAGFIRLNNAPLFMSENARVRRFFTDYPYDTYDPAAEIDEFDDEAAYIEGNIVQQSGLFYKCIKRTPVYDEDTETLVHYEPDDADYWTEIDDLLGEYAIQFQLITRYYTHTDDVAGKTVGRGEVLFDHQLPALSIAAKGSDAFTERDITESPRTYSRVAYDIADTDDWDESNTDLDHATPHRQDYTVLMDEGGIYMSDAGLYLNVSEQHSVRWITRFIDNQRFGLTITNTAGKVAIKSIALQGVQQRFAARDR